METEYVIETSGYVPENPCPYGISAPRRRSQPIRIQRSNSVKINRSGQHQKTGRDEVFASPSGAREPGTGDGSGALEADIVAALATSLR
jgi:hypothetical protein